MPQPADRAGLVRTSLLILVPFLIFVAWVGTRGLNHESLWYDEIWSLRYAGGAEYGPLTPLGTLQRVMEQSSHERNPPAYYLLLNMWGGLAGWSEFSVRTLSALIGLLAVAATYRAASDLAAETPRATRLTIRLTIAISAAITLGASAYFIQYSREVRAYVLMMLLVPLGMTLYWRLLRSTKPPRFALQAGFVVALTAMLYTHFTVFPLLVGVGLYHLLFGRASRHFWRVTGLVILAGVLFLPWAQLLLRATETTSETFRAATLSTPIILRDLAVSFSSDSSALFVLLLCLALLIRGRGTGFIWFAAIVSLLTALIANQLIGHIIIVRYILFMWPLLALLTGLGIGYLAQHKIHPAPVLAIWIAAGMLTSADFTTTRLPYNVRLAWREFSSTLRQHAQPDDLVIFHVPVAVWYRKLELEHAMAGLQNRYSTTEAIPGLPENDDYFRRAREFMGTAPRIWLAVDRTDPPNFRLGEFRRALGHDYVACYTAFTTPNTQMELYSRTLERGTYRFGDGIDLALREPLPSAITGKLAVLLGTRLADSVERGTYSIGLHVIDGTGKLAAQIDFGLPDSPQACKLVEIDTANLPAGDYTLRAIVYNWRTGARLQGVVLTDNVSAEQVTLGKVVIKR